MFVSSACALVYQVVWVRQILLIVGTTTAAVTTVLAVFMAGLGLGAWLFGAAADRSRRPLRLYSGLELGIGLYALALPMLITASVPPYVLAARYLQGQSELLLPVRVCLAFLLLLVPTVLMGGTLPVLIRHVTRTLDRFGANLGILYSMNLAGAVVGSLGAGFVLIHVLGVRGSSMAAVTGNLAVGLAALWLSGRTRPAGVDAPQTAAPAQRRLEIPDGVRPLVWTAVFLSGLLTMAFEILWTRMLVFTLGSSVYSFTVILATSLAGLALGSWLFAWLEGRARPLQTLAVALLGAGVAALVLGPLSTRSAAVVASLSSRFGWTGEVFLAATALCAALVVLVPATLMGVVLPLTMRLLVDDLARAGRRVGAAYLVNTVGCVLGSLLDRLCPDPVAGVEGRAAAAGGRPAGARRRRSPRESSPRARGRCGCSPRPAPWWSPGSSSPPCSCGDRTRSTPRSPRRTRRASKPITTGSAARSRCCAIPTRSRRFASMASRPPPTGSWPATCR